jgi:hypothetical protein
MPGPRRVVQTVTPQDEGMSGRPQLHAYGRGWIAWLANRSLWTVGQAIKAGEFVIGDPVSVICWALEKRKHKELAAQVREAFEEIDVGPEI